MYGSLTKNVEYVKKYFRILLRHIKRFDDV